MHGAILVVLWSMLDRCYWYGLRNVDCPLRRQYTSMLLGRISCYTVV